LSTPSFDRPSEVPPEITFTVLPKAIAEFHHLPLHVPVLVDRQEEVEKKGYDFNEGAQLMKQLLEAAPHVPGAYLYQLFTRKWDKLMELNPYFAKGRIGEAIPKLVEILEIDPECPLTAFQLAYCFRVTGELEKSESFYKQALRMAPDAGWIYSNLGRTYRIMGDKKKASEVFWKALELLPGDQFVLEQLVELSELFIIPKPGDSGEALFVKRSDYESKMKEALEKETDIESLMGLGWKLLQDRLVDLATQCFEKVLVLDPQFFDALLGLGTAHLESGRFKDAEKYLTNYLEENPESATGHLNLFKVYLAQNEEDLAWQEIQAAVLLDPNRLDVLRQLYFLFLEADRQDEGMEWIEQLIEDVPDSYGPLLVKAWGMNEVDNWEEAEEALRLALKRAPHNEDVLLYYTAELGRRGKTEDLIQLIVNEPEPRSLSLTINLALAYTQARKIDDAKKILNKFLTRPDLPLEDQQRAKALLSEIEKED
jgi:tetratricopeptide (TPR) repeat protein